MHCVRNSAQCIIYFVFLGPYFIDDFIGILCAAFWEMLLFSLQWFLFWPHLWYPSKLLIFLVREKPYRKGISLEQIKINCNNDISSGLQFNKKVGNIIGNLDDLIGNQCLQHGKFHGIGMV